MKIGETIVAYINRFAEFFAVLAFSLLVVDVSAAVFCRYILDNSIVWAEELARYLFVWITFIGGGLGVAKNIHIGVDSLTALLPDRPRKLVIVLVDFAIITFVTTLIVVGIQFVSFGMHLDSLLLGVPMACVYLAVPAGGIVMLVNMLLNLRIHIGEFTEGTRH